MYPYAGLTAVVVVCLVLACLSGLLGGLLAGLTVRDGTGSLLTRKSNYLSCIGRPTGGKG